MKKSLLILASLTLVWGIFGVSYALNIADLFPNWEPVAGDVYSKILSDYDARWYSNEDSLSACTTDDNEITITSPIISDDLMYEIPEYRIFVSPYRIDQIKSNDPSVDTSKIIMKRFKREGNPSEMTFKIGASDWLDGDTAYYAFVSPLNEYDDLWTPSKEVCFHMNMRMCMMDTECDTFDALVNPTPIEPEIAEPEENTEENTEEETHGAASDCVSMKLANVTHVTNGKTITLKWTDVGEGDVDIAVFVPDEWDPSNWSYKRIGTAKMSDEKFDYTMKWDGEHNFILRNACGEVRYKADAKMWEPEKIVTPATGPAENVLYIAIAAIVLYGAYTIFFRKSDNN